jgi:predicted SnoaL-like aldol condensation-catalyzing enzyme
MLKHKVATPTLLRSRVKLSGKTAANKGVASQTKIKTSPLSRRLTDSLGRLFARIFSYFPEGEFKIESMVIKGDKVFVKYRTNTASRKEPGTFISPDAVTTSKLNVFSVNDGRILERRDLVYQVRTNPGY